MSRKDDDSGSSGTLDKAVRSAVILIAGLVPHEAFKGTMIAIGKIHGIPPFGYGLGQGADI